MTIGFLHVARPDANSELDAECARAMVRSAKKLMPFTPVVHFTDQTTKAIKGVDAVRRKPLEPMGLLRMRHCAGVNGHWLFVDTDIIFQQPVSQVFRRSFDVAVTKRDWAHIKTATGFADKMPFNTGVVFSRCPSFWAEVYTRLRDLDEDLQEFMGEQQLICEIALEGRYHARQLSGTKYNFPPEKPDAISSDKMQKMASIVHYKGDRKRMMLGASRCA
jgi:hypothetical protein